MDVHLRGIDPDVWKALRVEALQRETTIAKVIEDLWREHQAAQKEKP